VGIVGRNESRIFGNPFLLYYKHETRAVASAERKVASLSFSALVRNLFSPTDGPSRRRYAKVLKVNSFGSPSI
jgi:hypothetical protein